VPPENALYYGDNLDVLRLHVKDESVDLVYLDPPFKSDQDYNVLFAEQDGSRAAAQIKAFEDTWQWDQAAAMSYEETVEAGGPVSGAMQAFRQFLGDNDMLAYLSMMAPRLVELRRVLKDTGSIYLHCDPTASHYLKQLMDAVFDAKNFRNEIIWHYRKWPTGKYAFQRNHDVLLFYSRSGSKDRTFNQLYMERAPSTLKRFGTSKIVSAHDEAGNRLPSQMADEESEGVRMDDVWDIGRVPPIKQLFPTQKPLPLLERVIRASSNEGDVVLDPFCGCGTAVIASQALKRRWIGIDITHLAVNLIRHRLQDVFGEKIGETYQVVGEPVSLPDAQVLAKDDPYQFQWWALGLVGARPVEQKKGKDKGIDGRLFFHDEAKGKKTKQVILSVKAGKPRVDHVRDLRGVIDREGAEIGALITMNEPTGDMTKEAASGGFYDSPWDGKHPRIQILTIKDLLEGTRLDMPPIGTSVTFKKAEKLAAPTAANEVLFALQEEEKPDD
jgi:site-specific DNA-methyltransferase (adenine-specific)